MVALPKRFLFYVLLILNHYVFFLNTFSARVSAEEGLFIDEIRYDILSHNKAVVANMTNPISPKLTARAPNDFTDCAITGACVNGQLKSVTGVASPFTVYSDLFPYWQQKSCSSNPFPDVGPDMLAMVGVKQADFICVMFFIEQDWISNTAFYILWINTAGVIIAADVQRPEIPYQKPGSKPLPAPYPVTRLSDVMFLAYQEQCKSDTSVDLKTCMARIQLVVHTGITNAVTLDVAEKTTDSRYQAWQYPSWPGISFLSFMPTDTVNFNALCGCPNGYGVAYMLAQHAVQLGPRIIDKVTLFSGSGLNVAWHIAPRFVGQT